MNGQPSEHKLWLAKANEDRLCIANELKAERQPWSVICFHAQQAVEEEVGRKAVALAEQICEAIRVRLPN